MKTILIAREKHDEQTFDISTPELKEKVYKELFDDRNNIGYYEDLNNVHNDLYQNAVAGDIGFLIEFLDLRSLEGYEYEGLETRNLGKEESTTDDKPEMITHNKLNLESLKKQVKDYVERTDCDHVDCDCQHYLFEEVIDTFYGKDIWDYINSFDE